MTLISSNLEKVTKNTCVFDFNIISQDNTFAEKNNYETKYAGYNDGGVHSITACCAKYVGSKLLLIVFNNFDCFIFHFK